MLWHKIEIYYYDAPNNTNLTLCPKAKQNWTRKITRELFVYFCLFVRHMVYNVWCERFLFFWSETFSGGEQKRGLFIVHIKAISFGDWNKNQLVNHFDNIQSKFQYTLLPLQVLSFVFIIGITKWNWTKSQAKSMVFGVSKRALLFYCLIEVTNFKIGHRTTQPNTHLHVLASQ